MSRSARHWNLRRRKELGQVHVRAVLSYLRGRPLDELGRWCANARARGMPDSTLEALLDACAWRAGRPVPLALQPRQPRLRASHGVRTAARRARNRRDYWHSRGLEPPPYNLREHQRRCAVCSYQLRWEWQECPQCGLDQWNPHLRRWEPNTNKETA